MKPYRIEGGAGHIGAGEIIGLTDRQYAGREHMLDDVEKRGKLFVGKSNAVLQFKSGEEIMLDYAPPKAMGGLIVPLGEPAPERDAPAVAVKAEKRARGPVAKKPTPGLQLSTEHLTDGDGKPVAAGDDPAT
ncbi:hypothetical protein C3941_23840 [Kaistia algarum]|uniref:hypothetical protein n=1 Tax=Kaistia algarum TaxID=2083279 RepID=UPI000CE7C1B0|nr:hypothetical protein [Kaistia algarum]MCX5513425.1 hypothetical protein [Kaistia algarum]PPE77431.1 hypothetical protein C3941_23840 [Kaistia algarum]